MPLTLMSTADAEARIARGATSVPVETKVDRLLKMIPTEVIAVYPGVLALSAMVAWPYYETMMAALGVLAVVLTLRGDGKANNLHPTWHQYVVRCLAFVAWTLVIGNPLAPFAITAERAHIFGVVGAAFIPFMGYFTQPTPISE